MRLRPYQSECVEKVFDDWKTHQSTLVVLPTGCGKTIVFAEVSRRSDAQRVLVIAHRQELIFQAAEKIFAVTGERPAIEMADSYADDVYDGSWIGKSRIVVASVQTLCRERRLAAFDPNDFGVVIVDEAHHSTADSYQKILAYFKQNAACKLLGVTATPDRADEEALGRVYGSVACNYEIPHAIRDGWLVPIEQQYVVCEDLDFSACRTTAGDLNGGDLERVMMLEKSLHGVVTPTLDLAGNRPTLVFAASVAHAEKIGEILNRHRPGCAEAMHGGCPGVPATSPDMRVRGLRRFAKGEYQYLVNCGFFLEGFDESSIAVVAVARPTKSRSLYAQMIGRGTRPLPGLVDGEGQESTDRCEAIACSAKPGLTVLDFVGNSGRHKLVSTADILGIDKDDVVIEHAKRRAEQKAKETGKPVDMLAELEEAEEDLEQQARQKRLAVVAKAKFSTQKIDPFDVFDLKRTREPGWFKGKLPTEKQLGVVRGAGIDTDGLSFHAASQIIGEIFRRRSEGLCTFKQAKLLSRNGFDADVPFADASRIIDALSRNRWSGDAARADLARQGVTAA